MAKLSMRHLYKVYPQGSVKAVSDFSMDIEDNEFIVFVGPSGCGKSTLLRMIAGLEEISAGEISIDGQIVNHIEPKDRDIAMVFQNYALYPHMTVFNNMAFGLQLKKMPEEEIKKRLDEAAEILDIKELLERKPKNMSGGQRQRVALGRAIVRNPKVFLLDEPLSNLDAKLRTQMRIEIIKLHEKLKSTFIYVTHDQVEAMTMGSRIVVLKDGFTQQIDTPQNLYNYPLNKFVAGFIGTPQMNFYDGAMEKVGDKIIFTIAGGATIEYNESLFERVMPEYLIGKKQVTLGIRPEDIYIGKKKQYPKASLACKVSVIEKLGSEVLLYGDSIFQGQENAEQEPCGITIKVDNKNDVQKDDVINFVFDPLRLHLFDAKSEKTILTRIPKVNHTKAIVSKDEITLFGQPFKLPKALKGQVADGEYIGAVASDAFIFSQKGVVVGKYEQEHWAGERLIKFYLEESPIFAVANEDDIIQAFDLDMKKISLLDAEGNTKLGAIARHSFLRGSFVRDKKGLKTMLGLQKENYSFMIEDIKVPSPDHMSTRLAYAFSRLAFDKKLGFAFQLEDISFEKADDCLALCAEIVDLMDYGREQIVKLNFQNATLYARATEDISAESINNKVDIYIPWSSIAVYDLDSRARIV